MEDNYKDTIEAEIIEKSTQSQILKPNDTDKFVYKGNAEYFTSAKLTSRLPQYACANYNK